MSGERICVAREIEGVRRGPALSRWVVPGLVALQDGTTVWASMRGRIEKCARKQMREATNHESLGAELLTHDHLWQLLTDARSPQTLTEAVDVSVEWTPEEDQNQSHHPDATQTNENETRNQQPTAMPSSPLESSQPETPPGLTRMNQMIATESNRPVYLFQGLDNMTATTEHSNATTIVAARLPKPDPIVTKTVSSATTTHPLSDLHDGAASTREQLHSFRPGHGVRAHGRIGTCRSQETTDIGISGRFAIQGRSFVIRWASRGAAEGFRRCYARCCRVCQS